ncbi:hypothetical protein [Spirosoma litoris]
MNFDELDKWENFDETSNDNVFLKQQFQELLSFQELLKNALLQPFEHLFSDIIYPAKLVYRFKELFLKYPTSYDIYDVLSDDSSCCISLNPKMRQVNDLLFPNWLDNTLKVVDHLVVYYIQIYLSVPFENAGKHGIETSRYIQLQKQACPHVRYAGSLLEDIYKSRNLNSHRTTQIAGKLVIQKINRHEIKRKNINNFEKAFLKIQSAFTMAYPSYSI